MSKPRKYEIKGLPVLAQGRQILNFVMINEEQQGANFTKDDVKTLIHLNWRNP